MSFRSYVALEFSLYKTLCHSNLLMRLIRQSSLQQVAVTNLRVKQSNMTSQTFVTKRIKRIQCRHIELVSNDFKTNQASH